MNPLTLLVGFHSLHQTKHCNLSPSLSQSNLRPLKVSRSVCGGRNVRAVDSSAGQKGSYVVADCYAIYVMFLSVGCCVFLGSMCVCWSERCLGLMMWPELSCRILARIEEAFPPVRFVLWTDAVLHWYHTDSWHCVLSSVVRFMLHPGCERLKHLCKLVKTIFICGLSRLGGLQLLQVCPELYWRESGNTQNNPWHGQTIDDWVDFTEPLWEEA